MSQEVRCPRTGLISNGTSGTNANRIGVPSGSSETSGALSKVSGGAGRDTRNGNACTITAERRRNFAD